jgi:hypothetical protein
MEETGIRSRRAIDAANRASMVLLLGFAFIETTNRLIDTRDFGEEGLGDFLINLIYTRSCLAELAYPTHFYYPPPFVIFTEALGQLGVPAAGLLWFGAIIASAFLCWVLTLRLLDMGEHPWRYPLALLACVLASYYIQWDLRAANSNHLYLLLLLGSLLWARRDRPGWAGFLLAASVGLKLYSALLLPYLALRGRWRWLGATLAWLGLLFVVLPALRLGPSGAFALTQSWLERILQVGDPLVLPDYYKSLSRTLLVLLSSEGGAGRWNWVDWELGTVRTLSVVILAGWLGMVTLYFVQSRRLRAHDRLGRLALCDLAVLALAPLPLSPTFQAHHAVVVLVPTMLLVQVASDGAQTFRRRWLAAGLLAASFSAVHLVPSWPYRGGAIMLALLIYLIGLIALSHWMRSADAVESDGADSHTSRPTARISSNALLFRTTPGRNL